MPRVRGFSLSLLAGALLTGGCGEDPRYGPADNPLSVTDVSGVEFGWQCDASGCKVTRVATTPTPDPCSDPTASGYSFAWGRFLEICSVCRSTMPGLYWSTSPGQCRIVACETDDQCPLIYERSPVTVYGCVNGLCQATDTTRHPRTALNRYQVEQLCFAARPRGETAPLSAGQREVQELVDASCPDLSAGATCALPAGCRMAQ